MRRALFGFSTTIGAVSLMLIAEILYVLFLAPKLAQRAPLQLDRTGSSNTVLWLGDSTVAGVGASNAAHALPLLVAAAAHDTSRLRVLAMSGARIGDVVKRQAPQVAGERVGRIYIEVGANDVTHLTTVSAFEKRYDKLLGTLPNDARVICIGIPDMGGAARFPSPLRQLVAARGRQLDRIVRKVADKHRCTFVDLAAATGQKFRHDPAKYLAADRFHPSDAGYQLWAEAIVQTVLEDDA